MNPGTLFATTFLAAAVEMVEMVAIVVGVGTARGWRSTLIGVGSGLVLLAVVTAGLGAALTAVPINALRLVVGALLLVFGLQWLRKGLVRVAAKGLAGDDKSIAVSARDGSPTSIDWTAFVLAFKGVVLEGLEVAFIVVTFGAAATGYTPAILGALAALVVVGGAGAAAHRLAARIPRSLLILIVGVLLSAFGTFWSVRGVGVDWPGDDAAIVALVGLDALVAVALVAALRQRSDAPRGARPEPVRTSAA